MRTPYALDRWVQAGHGPRYAGDKAGGLYRSARRLHVGPGRLGCQPVMQIDALPSFAFEREDNVLILHVLRPQRFGELIQCPILKEQLKCSQASIICVC